MKLYVLITNGFDGSFYPDFTLDPELIQKLEQAYKEGRMSWEDPGYDGDGFHYQTINVPDGSTAESLGVDLLPDDFADRFYDGSNNAKV